MTFRGLRKWPLVTRPEPHWINCNMHSLNKDCGHDMYCFRSGLKFRVCVCAIANFPCDMILRPWSWSYGLVFPQTHELCLPLYWAPSDLSRDQSSDEVPGFLGQHRQNQETWQWWDRSWLTGRKGVYLWLSLCSEVTSSPPLCSQAENCPLWKKMHWPFGIMRGT